MLLIQKRVTAVLGAGLLFAGSLVFAADSGTAAEAKAMLERAVAALKANQADALKQFNEGAAGFKEKDLYVFCGGPDGTYTAQGANPAVLGKSLKEVKDKTGKPLGQEIYAAAEEGKFNTVEYMFPRPGETEPVAKVSYVTKVGDQVCGVGYYK